MGVVGAVFRSVMQAAWALTPVASIALYTAVPPSRAAAEAMVAAGVRGGRAALPFAVLSGWFAICGAVCFATLRMGHPVRPPPASEDGAANQGEHTTASEQYEASGHDSSRT